MRVNIGYHVRCVCCFSQRFWFRRSLYVSLAAACASSRKMRAHQSGETNVTVARRHPLPPADSLLQGLFRGQRLGWPHIWGRFAVLSMSQKRSRTDGHLSKEQYNEGGGGASSSTQVTVQPSRTHSSTKGAGWLLTNGTAQQAPRQQQHQRSLGNHAFM